MKEDNGCLNTISGAVITILLAALILVWCAAALIGPVALIKYCWIYLFG